MNSLLTSFTFRKITFFSFFQLAAASIVDESYLSNQDLYDAILNTLFPITFVLLLKVKEKPKSIRNKLLPLLDDILYNIVTWGIPLIVSFAYEDSLDIKIFSIVNMCLHVFCAVFAIIKHKRIEHIGNVSDFSFNDLISIFLLNLTYYTDEVPGSFLATSTAILQYELRRFVVNEDKKDKTQELNQKIKNLKDKIKNLEDKMQKLVEKLGYNEKELVEETQDQNSNTV
ncbi:23121_t:CDS:2 [Gigaspora rosea]|nr:23121_t:CDS:2 [Gigaspora rosea]